MAARRSTAGVLILAAAATLSALAVAVVLTKTSRREMIAPEGWAALTKQEPDRAAAIFAAALDEHPRDPLLHFGAGAAAYARGRSNVALKSLRTAVEIDPDLDEAQEMLGRVAYDLGDSALAIRSMERAAALRPRDRALTELLERWKGESRAHGSYIEKPAGHFRILYEGSTQQHIGARVSQVLEAEHARIGRILNAAPPAPLTVVLYTEQAFHDITRSPAWAAGHYDGRIRVAVGGTYAPGDLDRIVTHELVHAVVASAASRQVPAWLNEGLATYLESEHRAWIAEVLRKASQLHTLEALDRGFAGLDEPSALVAYAQSATAAEILHGRLGSNIGAFVKLIGDGTPLDRALLEFQFQPDAFHAEWRRRVGLQ
jgi:tetratricopeptide (TPR) repeat protein